MWSCINDSQWKIGAFLTNSYANPKKFRSRKNQINFGLNQQPDCVVILHPDRKSSVILEADRSLIPIASLVDSTIPCEFYKRINYPIPANDPIQSVYLFRNSITKTAILERKRITAMNSPRTGTTHFSLSSAGPGSGGRRYYASASDPKGGNRYHPNKWMKILLSWSYLGKRRKITKIFLFSVAVAVVGAFLWLLPSIAKLSPVILKDLCEVVSEWLAGLFLLLWETFKGGHSATLGMGTGESTDSCEKLPSKGQKPLLMEVGEGSTRQERKRKAPPIELSDFPPRLRSREDLIEVPGSPEQQGAQVGPLEPAPPAAPAGPQAPSISDLQDRIKSVIRSCQRITPKDSALEKIYESVGLESASPEKRVQIAQILDDMEYNRFSRYLFPSNPKDKENPSIDFMVRVADWVRDNEKNILTRCRSLFANRDTEALTYLPGR